MKIDFGRAKTSSCRTISVEDIMHNDCVSPSRCFGSSDSTMIRIRYYSMRRKQEVKKANMQRYLRCYCHCGYFNDKTTMMDLKGVLEFLRCGVFAFEQEVGQYDPACINSL